jgi:predicted enzyme related to lactoylglutathione lyase
MFRKVDCVRLPVGDIEGALAFYSDQLGLELYWRTPTAVGLRMPDSDAEIVLHAEGDPPEVDLKVDSVEAAVGRFTDAGGQVMDGPFEIQIGLAAVVKDPWGNRYVLVDQSKGLLRTDEQGNVIA